MRLSSSRRVLARLALLALLAGPAAGLAAPPLTAERLAALRAGKPASVARAASRLLQARDQLGLGSRTDFTPRTSFVSQSGRTVARFDQTFDGRRVWGSQAIVHVEPGGQVRSLTQGLRSVSLASASPRLDASQATAIALRDLAPRGPVTTMPTVELVVFPTRFTGGLRTHVDPRTGAVALDRRTSTWAKPPAAPFVWAYEVRTFLMNRFDGHRETSYVVDASTGAILRKWSEIQADSPVAGTGNSYYRGTVSLSTALADDGTFTLNAMDRGSLPQPFVAEQGFRQMGLMTYWAAVDLVANGLAFFPYSAHATNAWGDGAVQPVAWDFQNGGMIFDHDAGNTLAWPRGALTPTGETAAVDAHHGLSMTWDFYRNVFGRDGIDDLGTSTLAIVHSMNGDAAFPFPEADNAHWSPWLFGMEFGDGTYPLDPRGLVAVTEMDITGHELTHGVTEKTAGLIYMGLSGGINEATSDILGKMVEAYANGGGTGGGIPDFAAGDVTPWAIARHSIPVGALRFMYKPSLDHLSADAWYDGLEMLDVHFSSGPLNRMFYFLSQGASRDAASDTYSPYLPGGMAGIGNDKAARIWFKALTEQLAPDADYDAARTGALAAAQELFGAGSPEEIAVMNAFAAVNVGSAPGQPPRVRVRLPIVNAPGSFLYENAVPEAILYKVQLFPTRADVSVRVSVENTADTRVVWKLGSSSGDFEAGIINADGTWRTPGFPFYADLLSITATSAADPTQFARGRVLLMELDADTDDEVDAVDLGLVAMTWGLRVPPPRPAAQVAGGGGSAAVDDWDLVFFTQAFTNAWPIR
jgi:Zn-dependent metalloprotease